MGSGRNLSSEKMAQNVALVNDGYCQKHITEESLAPVGVLHKKLLKYIEEQDFLNIG